MFFKLPKVKLSFFKKLFLLTFGVILLTNLLMFLFNFIFFNKFYIYKKKKTMVIVRNHVLENMKNPVKLKNYIEFAEDNYGLKIVLTNVKTESHSQMNLKKIYNSLSLNHPTFKVRDKDSNSGVVFLRYYEKLPNNYLLSIRSSLTVMDAQIENILIFHLFVTFFSLFISGFLVFIFSKKITKNITFLKLKAEKIAKLENPGSIVINSGDEIEDLSKSLNSMSKELSFAINNLKEFVSNASHELKTPISILCLYSQALARDNVEESKKKEYYNILLNKSLEMRTLTESLLILSKINSPDYKLKFEEMNLKNLINESLEQYDYLEFEKNIEVIINISDITIEGNYNLLKIAINNLVQNMYKYSPNDSEAEISLTDKYILFKNKTFLNIDNNVDINNFFEPFFRGSNALNEQIDGSGLGLSLVKKILELHNLKYILNIEDSFFNFIIYIKSER